MPQKIENWSTSTKLHDGDNLTVQYYFNRSNWVVNPVTHRPDLRVQNEHGFINSRVTSWWQKPTQPPGFGLEAWDPPSATSTAHFPPGFTFTSLDNQALARFNGKLRKGSASLGVSLASWKQSREMIVNRLTTATKVVDRAYSRLSKDKLNLQRLRRRARDTGNRNASGEVTLPNAALEFEFGWAPLIGDIHAVLNTACQQAVPPQWVRAAGKGDLSASRSDTGAGANPKTRETWSGRANVTVAACVLIDNPNLWMLNRLGLINPATVAWDLVPWSFVVNMFANVNQLISSFTDEVGLTITNRSTTRSALITYEKLSYSTDLISGIPYPGPGWGRVEDRYKVRTPGSFPSVSLMLKLPEVNWELAVIASSLLLQKAKRLSRLLSL